MLIREPKLYLVGVPHCRREQIRRFLADHGHTGSNFQRHHEEDADQLVALGGRLCYDSFSRGRKASEYLPHILEQGHFSVLEHAQFSVLFAGVSRSLTHEFVRHRHFGYSEQSQRYVLVPPNFVVPPLLPESFVEGWHQEQVRRYDAYLAEIDRCVASGLSRKEAHGVARSWLPESCETRILVSGNLRAWREMATKRVSPAAEAEIRRAVAMALDRIRLYTECLEEV